MADRSLPNAPKNGRKSEAKKEKTKEDKAAERVHRKEKATQELVDTEVTYNTLLGLLITHYVQPLSDYKLITKDQHSALFLQLQIIKGLSDKFLADLKERREIWDPKTTKLSDLFETFGPHFKMYQGYINNHEKATDLMKELNKNKKWIEYCTSVRSSCHDNDLDSYVG